MTLELLLRLVLLLLGLIVAGSIACLPLYKWRVAEFVRSSLFLKIIWWIPIFIVLVVLLYGGLAAAVIITTALLVLAWREYREHGSRSSQFARTYLVIFFLATLHIVLWFWQLASPSSVTILIAVAVASIMSDVVAFLMGNYMGWHKLPSVINNHKSWEGVFGQIIGALLGGVISIAVLSITVPWLLVIIVGLASATGDVLNSVAKRSLQIKDWGSTIPGHGGVMDRLSSLSLAIACGFWYLMIVY